MEIRSNITGRHAAYIYVVPPRSEIHQASEWYLVKWPFLRAVKEFGMCARRYNALSVFSVPRRKKIIKIRAITQGGADRSVDDEINARACASLGFSSAKLSFHVWRDTLVYIYIKYIFLHFFMFMIHWVAWVTESL